MKHFSFFYVIFTFFFMYSCSTSTSSECETPCKNYETCYEGNCILLKGACTTSNECQPSEVCDLGANQCIANPCNPWEEYVNGACRLRTNACNNIGDCAPTENCVGNQCVATPASCIGITCGGHGSCQIVGAVPTCNCSAGYQDNDNNLICLETCLTVNNCGANATSCDDSSGVATCTCNTNYYANSLYQCVSPCDTAACGNGTCVADGVTAYHCNCNAGYHEYNGVCYTDPEEVKAGNYFTCVRLSDNTIVCLGDNSLGQLGNATSTSSFSIATVKDINNATALSLGTQHACALLDDKTVKCWGDNSFGQLGNKTFINSTTPVLVEDLTNVEQLTSGSHHNCARLTDGKVKCWGMNLYAQLGNRKLENSHTPVYIVKDFTLEALDDIQLLASAGRHNCLQRNDGEIYCWGANGHGQLGIDKDWKDYPSCRNSSCRDAKEIQPINITKLSDLDPDRTRFSDVDALILGGNHTSALKGTALFLWGDNSQEQLAVAQSDNQTTPPETAQVNNHSNIQLGGSQTCGITGGKLYCLGRNLFGELGTEDFIESFQEITNLTNITTYDMGSNHGCAIEGTKVKCWGSNIRGELGIDNQSTTSSKDPVEVSGFN